MSAAFDRLRDQIYREYRAKGYGRARAWYIATSTAGEVAHRKNARAARRRTRGRKRRP